MNSHRLSSACRRLTIAAAGLLLPMLACGGARAAAIADPTGFHFDSPTYVVHENAGNAVITIARTNILQGAQIRYIALGDGYNNNTGAPFQCGSGPCTAISPTDFQSVNGELDFKPGQASAQFTVPIVDHGVVSVPKTIQLSLYGPSTYPGQIGLADPSQATLTILNDDPVAPSVTGNPLALATVPTGGNPLAGASFFVDPQSQAATAAKSHPAIGVIASQPGTARFGKFSYGSPYVPDIGTAVSRYLTRAATTSPSAVPLLATYRLVHGVHGNGDPAAEQQDYHNFIEGLAQGIGGYRAVLFLEEDSIITMPSLNSHGQAVRLAELRDAINVLTTTCPHLVIYLDAGAADALHARDAAGFLNRAGVSQIQGFFLNSTHFDWTSKEIKYGEQISRMTGGKHFVVNTGENGRGPLVPKDIVRQGNEVLCNPPGRGLGPKPTTSTGYPNVDMFAWTSNPGESGGLCGSGAPSTGTFWPAYAEMLVKNASFRVQAPRHSARRR